MADTRQPLSRERIAVAALAYIDEHGVDALSMRKLGAILGVEAMSLYNHVDNKEDLLTATSNLLFEEILAAYDPDPAATWQTDLATLATSFRKVAHRHPHALPLMTEQDMSTMVKYRFLERCHRVLTKAGFNTKEAGLAFDMVASWVLGAIRQEMGTMASLATEAVQPDSRDDRQWLPSELQEVVDFVEASSAWTPDQRFEFGIATVISGLESHLR